MMDSFLCSTEEEMDPKSKTTESSCSGKRTTDTKCNYRQEMVNIHSILTKTVSYFSLAKKYPTAVINPGSTYRAHIYSPVTITGQCFHEEGAVNKRLF